MVKDQSNDHTCDNPEIFFCIVGSEATVLKSQVAKKEDMIEDIASSLVEKKAMMSVAAIAQLDFENAKRTNFLL